MFDEQRTPCIGLNISYTYIMKYLALDYGTKKVGLALSDDQGTLAVPFEVIINTNTLKKQLIEYIQKYAIDVVVFGESRDQEGNYNEGHQAALRLAQAIERETGKKIVFQDERFSSLSAVAHLYEKGNVANPRWSSRTTQEKRAPDDAKAAAVILQRYLDTSNNN